MEKSKKRVLLLDFTGDPEESRRRNIVSALGGDGENRVTKTDERDGERFNIQYETSQILRNIRDISR